MYIENLIADKDTILTSAMQHPACAPKRKPTIETALKAVVSTLEMAAIAAITDKYMPLLNDMYDMYEIDNGEYDTVDPEARDGWSSGMDDVVEQIIEPLTPVLSADWLARNTIDTRLWEKDAITKFVRSMGLEVFKQLSYGKEPGQVLSNAGITRADVQLYLDEHMKPKSTEELAVMAEQVSEDITRVIATIHAQVGSDFDLMDVSSDLETLLDDDEILSGSAASRLGLDQAGIDAAQMFALDYTAEDAAAKLLDMLQNYKPGGEAPKRTNAPRPPKGEPAVASDFNGATVLGLVKDHSAVKETELAAALGVSRSTFVNWCNGKTEFKPDAAQKETLRNRIVADVNGLAEALCAIDGVPFERTYE
jgi:DNA-binding transcriptional regulator YdaS (Cro superfamily)